MQLPNFTISNILSPIDIPTSALQQFFLDRDVVDLHDKSLVSITVTELVDSVLIACSMDHIIADGNSYRHFLNMGSEVFQHHDREGNYTMKISHPPILDGSWFPDHYHGPLINVPFNYQHNDHLTLLALPLESRNLVTSSTIRSKSHFHVSGQ